MSRFWRSFHINDKFLHFANERELHHLTCLWRIMAAVIHNHHSFRAYHSRKSYCMLSNHHHTAVCFVSTLHLHETINVWLQLVYIRFSATSEMWIVKSDKVSSFKFKKKTYKIVVDRTWTTWAHFVQAEYILTTPTYSFPY